MGFLFTPIAFVPNTPVRAVDMNANFMAIKNADTFWGEWLYNKGTGIIDNIRVLTIEDYTTQDPQFAPNGLRFIRLRPSFASTFSDLSLVFSSVRDSTGDIFDSLYMEVSFRTFARFGFKHSPSGKFYPTQSDYFFGTGGGTFTFSYTHTPVRAKFNYGNTDGITSSAQNVGYSALGSGTINIAVSSSAHTWIGNVFDK